MAKHSYGSSAEEDDAPRPGQSSASNKRVKQSEQRSSLPPSSPPPTQEQLSDSGDHQVEGEVDEEGDDDQVGDSEDQESDEEDRKRDRQTEAWSKKNRSARGTVAQAGVVSRVDLTNFMCHTLLTVHFKPQVNFLTGHNGSGKSAILTAIMMALGGAARASGRGASNKSFVRDGQSYAICKVELLNVGPDAFRHEIYGDSIIIERRMNHDAGGGYKIQDSRGKTVDTKKATLDQITDHFNIQVTNPMTVLTQDVAREFLANSTPKQKYTFFIRGTQLEQLTDEYEQIRANLEVTRVIVDRKREVIPELKIAYRAAKKRLKDADQAIEQGAKLELLQNELAWAFVDETEEEITMANEEYAKQEREQDKVQLRLVEFNENLSAAAAECDTIDEAMRDLTEQAHDEEIQKLKDEMKTNSDALKGLANQKRPALQIIQRVEMEIDGLEKRIHAEKERLSRNANAENQPLIDAIEKLQHDVDKLTILLVEARHESMAIEEAMEPIKAEFNEIKEKLNSAQMYAANAKGSLKNLENVTQHPLQAYGPQTSALVQLINNYRRWNEKPIGPIGQFVKLKDQKYADVLESFFTSVLNAFVVTNREDRATLLSFAHKCRAPNPIIMQPKDHSFDCSRGEPDSQYLTIRRALQCTNPFVEMTLINALRMEACVLVEKRADGDGLMRNPPRNVSSCFSADGFKVGGIVGGSASSVMPPYHGSSRLNPDSSHGIARAKAEHERALAGIAALEQEKQIVNARLASSTRQMDVLNSQYTKHQRTVRAKQDEIRSLEGRKIVDEVSNVEALEASRDASKLEHETTTSQWNGLLAAMSEIAARNKPVVQENERLSEIQKGVDRARANLAARLSHAEHAKLAAASDITQYTQKTMKHQQQLAAYDVFRQTIQTTLLTRTEQAAAYCPRPQVAKKRTPAKLSIEIESTKRALKERERRQGDAAEDIALEVQTTKAAAMTAINSVADLEIFIKSMAAAFDSRVARWTDFRAAICSRSRTQFNHYLEQRGFGGRLHFDHDKTELHLRVSTNETATKKAVQLSGGEKSFSTICLLLTIWESIGCSIRCLDEYDVYMDPVNRAIATNLIKDTAKISDNTQFVLITPQSLTNLDPSVNVIRLQDPIRNQGTLAYGRAS